MEFIQEFTIIQGTLLTLQKKVGPLKNLKENDSGTKEKIHSVVNTLLKVLHSFEATNETEGSDKLRKISLFLVLNSDLKVCETMKEDPNWGHLIESAPTLSNQIMIDVFTAPSLRAYLHELVVYCPPALSLELLDIAASKLKQERTIMSPSCIATFIKAVYVKLLTSQKQSTDHICEVNCCAAKFMLYYSKFLEFLSDPNRINSQLENSQFLEELGQMLICSLELVTSCLMLFINPPLASEDVLNIYKMDLAFDYGILHQDSDYRIFDAMHEQLLSVLVVQIAYITVDVWLGWAEFDFKSVHNFSLQKYIAESMYKCHKVIVVAKEKGMKSQLCDGLITMLSSMASKPRDEDDEIKEADMALILNRIPDQSFCRRKWLFALFTKYGDEIVKEECVECINRNMDLMDSEIILLFLEKIYLLIEKGEVENVPEKVKSVVLCAVYQLNLDEQLLLLKEFLDKYGMNSHLCCDEYNTKVTKVFNTAVDSAEFSQDNKCIEIVNLCLQNPLDVMKRLLEHSVASDKQAQIMGDILIMLKPLHSLSVNKNGQEPCSLLVYLLHEIMQKRKVIEFSDTSFVSVITGLVTSCAVSPDAFLKNNLFPLIHTCLKDSNWSDIILWLETLQIFVGGAVKCEQTLDTTALLLTISQVMELSRKNLYTFSYAALTACDHVMNLISIVLESSLDVEDTSLVPLCEHIKNMMSPINQFYFFDLWKKSGNYSHFTADWKVYLLHWMYMEKCNIQPPWGSSVSLQRKRIILELSQLLPVCVKSEWQTIIQNLHNLMTPILGESSSSFVFECLIDAIQIMSVLSSAPCLTDKEQECAFSCLDFCIRNLSSIAKEELIGKPETLTAKTTSILFQKIANLNSVLPGIVKDSCGGVLLNLQVDFISKAICDMQMYPDEEEEEKEVKKTQWNEELRNMAISISTISEMKTRQALARKLQEGVSVV
ncbi:Uncharacterized protein GBIM_12575 [Gryllus bimaculatus]|nr:Uncharacterized protein GBIM_12575 [Gryllus bimaculatus]